MKWRKLGLVFCPDGQLDWMRSHASNPTPEPLGKGLFRVYFSSRDAANRSSVGWVELDVGRPTQVIRVSDKPLVTPGPTGSFDEHGASVACLVRNREQRYLYYVGWNLAVTVPWRNSIGLATSVSPDAPFVRYSEGPIMDRSPEDPYSLSYPWVLRETEGRWRMWYGSNLGWGPQEADMKHVLKHAESADGILWRRDTRVVLAFSSPDEFALARPTVVRDRDAFRMWYSYRGARYLIGYAESPDGITWTRRDADAGIGVSETGWDSDSVGYPAVFDHDGQRYMLYNGNGYGKTGFGIAVLENA